MKKLLAAAAALCALVAGDALAGTTTQPIVVTAQVNKACTFTVAPVGFGTYDPYGGNVTTQNLAGFTAACTKGTPYTITLATGTNGATAPARNMVGGTFGDKLDYNLYQDSNHTQIWGDGSNSTVWVNNLGAAGKATANYPVYGLITGGQDVSQDSYTDSVTVTFTF